MKDLQQELRALEGMLGVALPTDYREFLSQDRKGFFGIGEGNSPEGFWFPFKLQQLYGVADLLGQNLPCDSVQSWRSNHPGLFAVQPVRFPIGYDHTGEPFFIHLNGSSAGHVFTWIDASEPIEEVDLASSFSEFLALAGVR
jgi:hypothetical protein